MATATGATWTFTAATQSGKDSNGKGALTSPSVSDSDETAPVSLPDSKGATGTSFLVARPFLRF